MYRAFIYMYIYVYTHIHTYMYVCMYVCMYMCVSMLHFYVCLCVYCISDTVRVQVFGQEKLASTQHDVDMRVLYCNLAILIPLNPNPQPFPIPPPCQTAVCTHNLRLTEFKVLSTRLSFKVVGLRLSHFDTLRATRSYGTQTRNPEKG